MAAKGQYILSGLSTRSFDKTLWNKISWGVLYIGAAYIIILFVLESCLNASIFIPGLIPCIVAHRLTILSPF